MEDISGATAVAATSTAVPNRDSPLLNQSLDDIIKKNRAQRKPHPKNMNKNMRTDQKNKTNKNNNNNNINKNMNMNIKSDSKSIQKRPSNNRNERNNRNNRNDRMMDTTPINNKNINQRGKVVVRKESGRPANFKKISSSSAPRLRQPWEQLPAAPLPAQPLKISIRNELADQKPSRRSNNEMETDSSFLSRRSLSASAPAYEPRDALASREEYRIGTRFSTQGMAIDYQLPAGASYDTRRY